MEIALWCPRDLENLPGFTTNVKFGEWLHFGKLVYGRTPGTPSSSYSGGEWDCSLIDSPL